MMIIGARETLESLIEKTTGCVDIPSEDAQALRVLFSDFLGCAYGTPTEGRNIGSESGGTDGIIAGLVVKGSILDLDDVHWPTLVHPGAVIWPVILGVGANVGADGPALLAAAYAGYSSTIALAMILGPGHAARFHATSTCGAFGAAIAAATLNGLTGDQLFAAGAHAISAAGGIGQATLERSNTVVFHRIAAAITGCQAAHFAKLGYSASRNVLDGERGALVVLGGGTSAVTADRSVDPSGSSVRIYPVNGFAQGPVKLAAQLGERLAHEADSLAIEVPRAVANATSGPYGGCWWDMRSAVAAAFASGNPFDLAQSVRAVELRKRVEVKPSELRLGACRLTVNNDHTITEELMASPGSDLSDINTQELLAQKWKWLLGSRGPDAQHLFAEAQEILQGSGEMAEEAVRRLMVSERA